MWCGLAAVAAMGRHSDGRVGGVRRVGAAAGVAGRVDVMTVLESTVAYRARSEMGDGAAHGTCHALR